MLSIIGLGLFYTNKSRIVEFKKAYYENAIVFKKSELERIDKTLKEYNTIVFKAIPIIIIAAALIIIFINSATWRAISITTIAMLIVILLIDGTAHSRIENYRQQLLVSSI